MEFKNLLRQYDYALPPELIAQKPANPRDSARLLVYQRQNGFSSPKHGEGKRRGLKIKLDKFSNIGKYLPKNSVLVFNQTKVWPARLLLTKPTGGKVEILYISHDDKFITSLANKKLSVGLILKTGRNLKLEVMARQHQYYVLKPNFSLSEIKAVLKKYGQTPLPPYIKNSPLSEKQKRRQYQAIFAKAGLSVAAPTASLHFTKNLIQKLRKQGIGAAYVRLDVGLGTFAPLQQENLDNQRLHKEYYEINRQTAAFLNKAKKQGRPIIAVGTTVTRTLETAAQHRQLKHLTGQTRLFIRPGYKFKFIDGLITNFHVPKSSLMMLVAALTGRQQLLELYQKAINKKFRFFSFGDGMLIKK